MLSEGRDDIVGLSYRLAGWALYDKYDKVIELMQSVLDSPDQTVAKDAVSFRESVSWIDWLVCKCMYVGYINIK